MSVRPMVHGDFKPGEVSRSDGTYECRTCAARGRRSRIDVARGRPFPLCPGCEESKVHEVDTVWKHLKDR